MSVRQLVSVSDPRAKVLSEMREVLTDFRDEPHVFIRVRLTGWRFPHRVTEPFALIGDLVSHHVVISRDGTQADAYFDAAPPAATVLSFGYGNVITWDFPFPKRPMKVVRLDRHNLPGGTIDPFEPG
jgi:hypothetical protein